MAFYQFLKKTQREAPRRFFTLLFAVSFAFWGGIIVLASPPDTPYAPGYTLTPDCAPGDPNCTVYPPLATGLTAATTVTMSNYPLNFDSGTFYIDSLNNRIGIGTTSPATALDMASGVITLGNNANPLIQQYDNAAWGTLTKKLTIQGGATSASDVITFDAKGILEGLSYQDTILAEPSLTSYWQMDNNWTDSKGANDGTATGATFGTAKYGSASGSFDGNDYVTMGTNILNYTSNISVEAWIKETGDNANGASIVDNSSGSWSNGYALAFTDPNTIIFFINFGWGGNEATFTLVNDGEWHHVVGTYDGTTVRIYVDGVEGTPYSYSEPIEPCTTAFRLGYGGGGYFTGLIDEAAVYNTALSAGTILEHFNATGEGPFRTKVKIKNSGTTNVDLYLDGDIYGGSGNTKLKLTPSVANGATAVAYTFDTENALSTSGAKLLSVKNAGIEKAYIDKDGGVYFGDNVGIGTTSPRAKLDAPDIITSALTLSPGTTLSSSYGFNSFLNLTNNLGIRDITFAQVSTVLNPSVDLINIGSIQAGQTHLRSGGTFAARADYADEAFPYSVAIGDVNGDGKNDLAAANHGLVPGPDSVSVLLNNGDGTFAAKADYTTGEETISVAIGDVNGDGKNDLAAANYSSNTVSVLLNNGDGTFAAKADYTTGITPRSVAIGDVNGDGKNDLAAANESPATISVLLNNGNGTFAAKADYTTAENCCSMSVAIGDVNGDGKNDLAAANEGPNTISVLLNNFTTMFFADALTGNVGIGTSTPYAKLSVWGGGTGTGRAFEIANSASSTLASILDNGTAYFAGNVGIGTTTPWRKLSVAGTAGFSGLTNDATGYYLCLNTTTYEMATSTTACGASSLRFKENVQPMTYGLSEILQLNPVFYDWKDTYMPSENKRQIGLIAEEASLIIPELAGYDSQGEPINVDYPKATAVIIKAIQELNEKISNSQLSISNQFSIESVFNSILDWLGDKVVRAKEFVASKITVDKVIVKQGFEIEDALTGEVYCVRIYNGEWEKFKGTCVEISSEISTNDQLPIPNDQSNPNIQNTSEETEQVEPVVEPVAEPPLESAEADLTGQAVVEEPVPEPIVEPVIEEPMSTD